jgi:hypothetical protein
MNVAFVVPIHCDGIDRGRSRHVEATDLHHGAGYEEELEGPTWM